MKKNIFLIVTLLFCANASFGEIFVDYVPESLKNNTQVIKPQTVHTKQVTTSSVPNISSPQKAPQLPAHLQNDANISGTTQKITKRTGHEVYAGTWFELKSLQNISDRTKKNTVVKFATTTNQSAGAVLLPKGTIFKGHIEQSHKPQLTSNGGLVKIVIDDVIYQNISNDLKTQTLKVNNKRIYFNNIKGQRRFWKNTGKDMAWGCKVCAKSYKKTAKFSKKGGIYWLLTPFPAIGGTLILTANAVVAPFVATFQKGGSVYLKSGTQFTIKLKDDAQIYVIDINE